LVADIGATHALVVLADLSGTELASESTAMEIADGPEAVLGWLVAAVDSLLAQAGASGTSSRQ
jgi:predicted NBD/HSP70 family sugar kinase